MADKPAVTPDKAKKSEIEKAKREKARERANESIKMAVNSEQNYLLHFLPEILTSVQKDRDIIDNGNQLFYLDDEKKKIYNKRFFTLENNSNVGGTLQRLLSFLTRGKKVQIFEKIPNSILSSFLPEIKIFKVFKGKRGKVFNWQIPFNTTIDSQDIISILNSGRGMVNNAILKSFSYEYRGTDFYSAEKNIKATLQIGFDSVDKLTERMEVEVPEDLRQYFFSATDLVPGSPTPKKEFRFADLVMSNDEVFTKKPDPSFYTIKVLIGIKEPEPKILNELEYILKNFNVDLETLRGAITESKMVLTLYHTGHDLQFNEDGSIDFNLEYVAANETSIFAPRYDVLLVDSAHEKIIDLIKDGEKIRENQTILDACFNQNKNLLDTKSKKEQEAAKKTFDLKIKQFKEKLKLIELETNSLKTNVKAGFLTAVQEEVPIYEVKVEPKFKSLFKQLADSKNPAGLKELTEEVYEKTTVKPGDIQRIKGQDPTLKKLVDLYKKLQRLNEELVNMKKRGPLEDAASLRRADELRKQFYPDEPSLTVGDWWQNVSGFNTRSKERQDLIDRLNKDPRTSHFKARPFVDEAEIAGLHARAFNDDTQRLIDAELSSISERRKAFAEKEKQSKELLDKVQNDISLVVDFSGQKTRFVLLGDILNLGLKCKTFSNADLALDSSSGASEKIEFLVGLAAMAYKQFPDERRTTLNESGLNKAAYVNSYNVNGVQDDKFTEILYGMEKFPISINRLNLFFIDKIAKRATEVYPLTLFLTDIMELLEFCTIQALSESTKSVVKLDIQKSFLFIPTEDFKKCCNSAKNNVINIVENGALEKTDISQTIKNKSNFTNLCYYYSRGFVPNFRQRLIPDSDQNIPEKNDASFNQIYNISLGSKTGILKKISYTKNKQPYATEARMKASGELAQGKAAYPLRVIYDASITTYGASLFRPGDHVYLNPVTISARENATQLVLDQLGIGGFYIVNKSSTTISDSSFETVVDAKFTSYTDGNITPNLIPSEDTNRKCADNLKGILEIK